MRIIFGLLFFVVLTSTLRAQPATEIYLFDLKVTGKKMVASHPVNISAHTGYDNQPFFHPDKPLIYYASAEQDGKTNIKIFDYGSGSTRVFISTPEREYSPTVTPDGKFISCIIQRDSGAQDLAKYPIDGGPPIVLIDSVKVGYHAWKDNDHVVVFVLGELNELREYSFHDGRSQKIASHIGRSVHKVPGSASISFVDKSVEAWTIKKFSDQVTTICPVAFTGKEDIAWTPGGRILMSDGAKIYFLMPGKKNAVWMEVVIEGNPGLQGITRMAVNASGNKLAVVANE